MRRLFEINNFTGPAIIAGVAVLEEHAPSSGVKEESMRSDMFAGYSAAQV